MSEQDVDEADGDVAGDTDGDAGEKPEGTLADALGDLLPQEHTDGEEGTPVSDVEVEEEFLERVERADTEEIAGLVATLRERVETLEERLDDRAEEVADLESRLKRKQADFQNYKKRQKERLAEEKQRATEDLVERLVDVRDNLARALDQDEDADIRDGVETTLRQFDEQFERENVDRLEPEPGEEVDPQRHETLATIESGQPEGTIAERHRPGYEMAGKVIRPAQVVVSDGSGDEGDAGEDSTAE